MKRTLKIFAFILILALALGFISITLILLFLSNVNLDLDKLKRNESSAIICYADGSPINCSEERPYVTIENIPNHVIDALIAIEDKRFYNHNGVDFKSVIRALKNNTFTNNTKQGGSTITQQLIKNTYLSGERTVSRKLKEIRLALKLEKKLTKNEILECYLNTVYFGEGAYGIASASKRFFNKDVSKITVEEGATLIACLKAPSIYSPYKNMQKSRERRNLVLKEMYNQGFINENTYNISKNTDIIINFENNYENNNFLYDEILRQSIDALSYLNPNELNGFKIYTSVDKKVCDDLLNACSYDLNCDVSIMVTNNQTGEVIGYYTTVGSIKRCPASTAKPWLIYAPAIEEDLICLASKILDEKTNFDGYQPSNYNDKYYGYVSAKDSLVKSLNVPSVKLCNMLGLEKVKSYANKLGIEYTNNDLSIALGNLSGGITLQQLTDAYSVFSNNGYLNKSSYITKITNAKGKTIYENVTIKKQIFSNSTVFLINDALKACAKTGTADKLNSLSFEVCAKTGTNGNSQGNQDAYCIAYTTNHTVAVWLGKADGGYISNSITGGNYPTQIAKTVLSNLYQSKKPTSFTTPTTVKQIDIDKSYYQNDCKIYKNIGNEKDGVKFWFKSDYEIENPPKKEILPIIKDYKITCNYCNIEIYCESDNGVFYKIFDADNKELFDSFSGEPFTFKAPTKGVYNFIVKPYMLSDGEIIFGEEIKLPSVLVEGKSNILDTDWWVD